MARTSRKATDQAVEETAAPTEQAPSNETLPTSTPETPLTLQMRALKGIKGESRVNVRLLINGSDDDGIRAYDEQLPESLLRAILSPEVDDFFIPIQGTARTKPPRTKTHFLHTSSIREVLIFDEFVVYPEV